MASRRSRLKAVANLPIRRKPFTVQQEAENSKLLDDKTVESTLEVREKIPEGRETEELSNAGKEDCFENIEAAPCDVVPAPDNIPNIVSNECEKECSEEVPAAENLVPKLGCNNKSSQFGRRVKPCVSLTALKERQPRVVRVETCLNNVDHGGEKNEVIVQENDQNLPVNIFNRVSTELESTNQEIIIRTGSEIAEDGTIMCLTKNVESVSSPAEGENITGTQSQTSVCDGNQKNTEKSLHSHLKSPVHGSKQVLPVNCLNSGSKPMQEIIPKQRQELFSQNKSIVDHSISHVTSQNSSQLQYSSAGSRRTSTIKQKKPKFNDFARKVADARREFQRKYEKIPPDRSSLRMIDLIFYNPSTNPMESKSKFEKRDAHSNEQELLNESRVDDPDPVEKSSDLNAEDDVGSEDFGKMPVPQVKIGSNGEIILDEKSLVIETTDAKKGREDLQNSVPVFEDRSSKTCYYKRKTQKSRDWSDLETKRFYKALNTIGTDFSLMQKYFPVRTRLELKNKFKREEKLNRNLVDKALNNPSEFDITQFEKYLATEKQVEEEETERRLQRKIKVKRSENRIRIKSSLLAKEITESDEDLSESQRCSSADQLRMKLNDRTKKSNDVNLLCEKYSLNGTEKINESVELSSPAAVCEGDEHNSSSKLFASVSVNELSNASKIRDAFDEIQNISHPDPNRTEVRNSGSEGTTTECDEFKDSALGGVGVVDEFYQAVVSLSTSLKSDACKNLKANRVDKKMKRIKPNVPNQITGGKRKSSTQCGRKSNKKQKDCPFMSTLDIETYDPKYYDSNSSSNDSNDNSFTSTKTITDQDFIKLLAANAKNMKESKIQFQITEDCSLEKNVEIILDNVPSITLSEI